MSKKLCKLVSDGFLDDHTKKYTHMVNNPKFICMKCGRVANDEDALCRPKKLKDKKEAKKSDGMEQIGEDMATEKMASDIERKVLGKSSKKKSKEKTDEKVQKRIVKISKSELRKKQTESEDEVAPLSEPAPSLDEEISFDENLPNED